MAGAIKSTDTLPEGPYSVGMTNTARGPSVPYTVVCGDGRAIAGHIESRQIAERIAWAMNEAFPPLRQS